VAIEICESEIKWPSWKELGLVESKIIRRYEKEKEKEKEKEDQDSSKSKGTSSSGNEESAGGPRMGRS